MLLSLGLCDANVCHVRGIILVEVRDLLLAVLFCKRSSYDEMPVSTRQSQLACCQGQRTSGENAAPHAHLCQQARRSDMYPRQRHVVQLREVITATGDCLSYLFEEGRQYQFTCDPLGQSHHTTMNHVEPVFLQHEPRNTNAHASR